MGELTFISQVIMPLMLGLVMFGLGLGLTIDDFTRLFRQPLAVIIGLICQMILLPLIGLVLIWILDLSAHSAVAIMVICACPGGVSSNIVSHLAKGNTALSVSLTGLNSVICAFTTPFIIVTSLAYFPITELEGTLDISLLDMTISLMVITLLPISLGLIARHYYAPLAQRLEGFFNIFSIVILLVMLLGLVHKYSDTILQRIYEDGMSLIALNILALCVSYGVAKLCGLLKKEQLTIMIEGGMQNTTMAIVIATTYLMDMSLAVSAGAYSIFMYVTAFVLVGFSHMMRGRQFA